MIKLELCKSLESPNKSSCKHKIYLKFKHVPCIPRNMIWEQLLCMNMNTYMNKMNIDSSFFHTNKQKKVETTFKENQILKNKKKNAMNI